MAASGLDGWIGLGLGHESNFSISSLSCMLGKNCSCLNVAPLATCSPILSCSTPRGVVVTKWLPLYPVGDMVAARLCLRERDMHPLPPGKAATPAIGLFQFPLAGEDTSPCWAAQPNAGVPPSLPPPHPPASTDPSSPAQSCPLPASSPSSSPLFVRCT